jgi:hypothetical protein
MKTQDSPFRVQTISEILAYESPNASKIVIDAERATCTLHFDYAYEIDLDRIKTERDLLAWVKHLAGKTWMTSERLELFIDAVAEHRGFRVRL